MSTERRCPSCGALVAADAEWCGQCFARLVSPTPAGPADTPSVASPAAPATTQPDLSDAIGQGSGLGMPTWTCPTCGEVNDIVANACVACSTPFARLFERPDEAPGTSPGAAFVWSLAFPGLGHWRAGKRYDAVARAILGAWILGTLVVLLLSSAGAEGGPGGLAVLIALYGVATVALWAVTAVDAGRAASGAPPMVSSRVLLWASVALVVLSMLLATVIALPAADRPTAGAIG